MTSKKETLIKGAIATREKDVAVPASRRKLSSFSAVVADLEVGESASRSQLMTDDMTMAELREQMRDMKDMMRNNVAPAVKAAKKDTGGQYTVECGEVVTPGGALYLVIIVLRTE